MRATLWAAALGCGTATALSFQSVAGLLSGCELATLADSTKWTVPRSSKEN